MRLFEQHGFHPQKQVSVAPSDGELPISVADFAVPERRIAIYVDGAAFHVGANLRRDRFIRDRLRNGAPPWRIEELRATDLAGGKIWSVVFTATCDGAAGVIADVSRTYATQS